MPLSLPRWSLATMAGLGGVAAFSPCPRCWSAATPLFAGGFGAKTQAPPRKKAKKQPRSGLLETLPPSPSSTAPTPPRLDRFGLPFPTEEDVFPPLAPEVPRIAADCEVASGSTFDRAAIAEATRDHLGIHLDTFEGDKRDGDWTLRLLHRDPPVFVIDHFFTEEECREYVAMIEPGDATSQGRRTAVQVTSPTFSAHAISKRTSTTWFCRYEGMSTLLAKTQRLLNIRLDQMEEPQLVRYRTGEEFSFHYDEIPKMQLGNGGQRIATLLVYLNDLGEGRGGGTVFRDLEAPRGKGGRERRHKKKGRLGGADPSAGPLTVRPKAGTALLFFPAYEDGTPDARTLHKGEVALDTKMIAQLWIHERDYEASVPEGNRQSDATEAVAAEAQRLGF